MNTLRQEISKITPTFIKVIVRSAILDPYRLYKEKRRKRQLNRELYDRFRGVECTPPLKCNPDSQTEVHCLTCHHHTFMYLTAIKSFLRFYDNVAVVAHDDGTLTDRDKMTLSQHVEGISIIERSYADGVVEPQICGFEILTRLRKQVINFMELTDTLLLAQSKRIILMNSDILFFSRPTEIIEWIEECRSGSLCVKENNPTEQESFLKLANCQFPPRFTCGLACLDHVSLDLRSIESILEKSESEKFDTWFIGQNLFPVLIEQTSLPFHFLDQNRYQVSGVFIGEQVMRHYWTSTEGLRQKYFQDATEVHKALMSNREQ